MKRTLLLMLFVLVSVLLSAGNLAVLENLGFNLDGRYFMFGQHVLLPDTGQVYAEIGIVNVAQNDFVTGGWKKKAWKIQMLPNQDSRGALYELLGEVTALKDKYGINHLKQGRMLYTKSIDDKSVDSGNSDITPTLSFRDFERGQDYHLELVQKSQATGDHVSAAFHILVTVENTEGAVARYTVGRSSYMRPDITSYSIARVWVDSRGKFLIIAVAKESLDLSVHYMVETLRL